MTEITSRPADLVKAWSDGYDAGHSAPSATFAGRMEGEQSAIKQIGKVVTDILATTSDADLRQAIQHMLDEWFDADELP